MPKAKVIPPRTPRGESAKVTIANQAREIAILTNRCEELVLARDTAMSKCHRAEVELFESRQELMREKSYRSADVKRHHEAQAEILKLQSKLEGYRLHTKDRARFECSE